MRLLSLPSQHSRPRPVEMKHFVPTVLETDEPYWWRVDGVRPTPTFYVPLTEQMLDLAEIRLVQVHASQDRADPFGLGSDRELASIRIDIWC